LTNHVPFAFTGIWDVWVRPAGKAFTVAILTTEPNELTAAVHDRMLVIRKVEDEAAWLDLAVEDPARRMPLVGPHPADPMASTYADPALNRALTPTDTPRTSGPAKPVGRPYHGLQATLNPNPTWPIA
jgi:putative SOS response-associated peptidase YedK